MPEEWYLPGGFWSLVWGVFLGIVFIVWLTIDINLRAASYMILQTIACFKLIGNICLSGELENSHVHKTSPEKKWFTQFGVEDLDWSPQSPDLNPIQPTPLN